MKDNDIKDVMLTEFAKKMIELTMENVDLEDKIKDIRSQLIKAETDVQYWREAYYDIRNLIMRNGEEE
jgi:hypothetical protein